MTPLTPEPPECEPLAEVTYAVVPADEHNRIADAAVVCGLLGLAMCPPLGLLGVIFGIIGLVRSRATRPVHRGRSRAIFGLVCGAVSVALVPMVFGLLERPICSRSISKRAVCASNAYGIGQGFKLYANEYNDWYPAAPFVQPDGLSGDATAVSFIGNLSEAMTLPPDEMPRGLSNVHPSRSLFLLVTDSSCSPGQFVCPSTRDSEDDLRNPDGSPSQPGINRFDFRGYPYLSYGCQLPFGSNARPNENIDPSMPLIADRGPCFEAGTPIAGGIRVPDAARGSPGAEIVGPAPGTADPQKLLQLPNTEWEPFNSPNHGGEGQNVLFQDGHAEFVKKPIAGVDGDNIYTTQADFSLLGILLGRQPADFVGPLTNTDSVIVP